MEGRPKLRLREGALIEHPQGVERRTGRVEPMSILDRCAGVLEGPRNLMRVDRSRRKAAEVVTRSLNTLKAPSGIADQLPRQASLARSVGNYAPGFFSWAGSGSLCACVCGFPRGPPRVSTRSPMSPGEVLRLVLVGSQHQGTHRIARGLALVDDAVDLFGDG